MTVWWVAPLGFFVCLEKTFGNYSIYCCPFAFQAGTESNCFIKELAGPLSVHLFSAADTLQRDSMSVQNSIPALRA